MTYIQTTPHQRPQVATHRVTLPPNVVEALQQLSRDASAFLKQPVSGSDILWALVRQVTKHGAWATEALFLEVKRERKDSVTGDKKKGSHQTRQEAPALVNSKVTLSQVRQ